MSAEKADQADTGLGLKEFLAPKPVPVTEKAVVEPEKGAADAKGDEKASPSPEGDKKEVKFLARADKRGEKEPAKAAEPVKAAEKQPTGAPASEKPVVEAPKPSVDWDAGDNPWRKRAEENEKRYRDTAAYATQTNKTNLELKRQLEIINKKLDGTYDPEKDVTPAPSPEESARLSAIVGRAEASLDAAYKEYGKEKVDGWLTRYAEVFGQDPFVQQRILHSKMPVYEAIAAVRGYEFFGKHGSDPDKIMESIRKELTEELAPKIREEEAAKFLEKANKREEEPKGLAKARASGSGAGGDKPLPSAKHLNELFPR